MNRTWRGRALGCPPVSVGGRNNHAVVVLTYTVFLGFDFNSRKNGGPQTRTADYELQMFSRNQAELRQFWRGHATITGGTRLAGHGIKS
jgi:hypothetical protein